MRDLLILGLVAIAAGACVSATPQYKNMVPSCYVPTSILGMKRIRPSDEQVAELWSLLDLKQGEYVEFWFEDPARNVKVGISDGSHHWQVDLVRSGETYSQLAEDWRELEVVCVG
jgi:hypothetical protein